MTNNNLTVKAIFTNINNILTSAPLSYELETLKKVETIDDLQVPLYTLKYNGEIFDFNFGENRKQNDIDVDIILVFSKKSPTLLREAQADVINQVHDAITENTLNVGDLEVSKLVIRVEHLTGLPIEDDKLSQITYNLLIKYDVLAEGESNG